MLPSIRQIWYSFLAGSAAVVGDVVGGAVGESVIDANINASGEFTNIRV